jgi:spore coat protein U-like protein
MIHFKKSAIAAASVLATCAFAAPAMAATASSTLSVTATVTANCTVSTSAVAFGNVNTLSGSPVDASGSISVTCTNGTAWSAAAGAGGGTGATVAARKMLSGANLLNYALYSDSGRTTLWGDGTLTTAAITGTGSGSAQSSTIYGRVASGQSSVPAGSYADTVAVTVTY